MFHPREILTLALLLGATGCQHGANFQRLEADRLPLAPDRREAVIERPGSQAPVAAGGNTLLLYLSVPLHPIHGVQFAHSRIVLWGPGFTKSFAGPFEPLPAPLPGGNAREIRTEDFLQEAPPAPGPRVDRDAGRGLGPVETQRNEYAETLRAHVYQAGLAMPASYAQTRASINPAAAEED
jgi:hypothetical protein